LVPALKRLHRSLQTKARQFDKIVKIGRTHLQDATPIRLGQEFAGYASQIKHDIRRLERARHGLAELAIGGTAVGTGINTHAEFGRRMTARLSQIFDMEFREAEDHFEAQSARDAVVDTSGVLKTIAVSLTKIANDIRWLSSGPRTGLGEIDLPAVQPGSSIMPGKVNPVMAEAVLMVAAQVIGNDTTVTISGMSGNLELNVMMPVMVHNLLESIRIMSTVSREFTDRCVAGITADEERCRRNAETTAALATALAPTIGYDKAAEVAKRSVAEDKTLREVVLEMGLLSAEELDEIIDFRAMTEPGIH
jgi:fumarate hydratase class II